MAHNIMNREGIDCMFVVGDRNAAWHLLGQRATDAVSWQQAMELAGIGWQVEKRPLYKAVYVDSANREQASYIPADGAFGVFRTDDNAFLGAVGAKYVPIQNKDAFSFVDTLLEAQDGAHYDSAGALGNGERIWCSAKVPFDFAPVAGDTHLTYLMFSTSHDGQTSATCKLTTVRVVCQNTLSAALADAGAMVRIRHTVSAGERLGRAAILMQGVGHDVAALNVKLGRLAQVAATDELIERVMARLFPETEGAAAATKTRRGNIVAAIGQLYAEADGGRIAGVSGSAYMLLNAVTEYADHFRSVRGTDGTAGQLVAARAEAALFGTGDALKREALDVIGELVGVAS